MENSNKTKDCLIAFLNIVAGAGAVVGGAYVLSRLKEKQNTEIRLERMEQILEEITEGKKEK